MVSVLLHEQLSALYARSSAPASNTTSNPTSSKPVDILIRFYIPTFSNIFIYLKRL